MTVPPPGSVINRSLERLRDAQRLAREAIADVAAKVRAARTGAGGSGK